MSNSISLYWNEIRWGPCSDREDFIVETLSSYSNILYRREQKKIMLDKYLGLCCQGQT